MRLPASTLLDWHQARRAGGVPTVSVLAGPVGLGVREWRRWAGRGSLPVAQVAGGDAGTFASGWVAEVFARADPTALAGRWVAGRTAGVPDPARLTRYDLDQLWRTAGADPADPAAAAAYLALAAAADGRRIDPAEFARALAEGAHAGGGPARVFAGVSGLDPSAHLPALLVVPADPDGLPAWFGRTMRELEAVAVAVPRLPVGVCVPTAAFESAVAADPGSRATAVAREGMIPVSGVSVADLTDQLRAAGVGPPPAATLARLAADGLDPAVAAAFVDAARAVRRADPADVADDFRSVHERFLFEQLESLPETAGRFRPNRPLPFRHGTQAAEADLVAEGLRVVVEVDGAHYHLNQPQYRRDRRKDWEYQRHGYLVLRFLAEDVVDDLETILATILDAVAFRRDRPPPER